MLPSSVTSVELRRVARLARVGLDDDELRPLSADLSEILDLARQVAGAHPHVSPGTSDGEAERSDLREDRPSGAAPGELLEDVAPELRRGHILVPRVL